MAQRDDNLLERAIWPRFDSELSRHQAWFKSKVCCHEGKISWLLDEVMPEFPPIASGLLHGIDEAYYDQVVPAIISCIEAIIAHLNQQRDECFDEKSRRLFVESIAGYNINRLISIVSKLKHHLYDERETAIESFLESVRSFVPRVPDGQS